MKIDFKERRLELGLTQPQVAKIVGVSIFTVRNWEQGVTTPSADNLIKLKKVLKIEEEKWNYQN